MLDLHLNDYSEIDEESGVIFIDSIPTYSELIQCNQELMNLLTLSRFDEFISQSKNEFTSYMNMFVASEYIQEHGYDSTIKELVGEEGLLSDIGNALIRFVRWLIGWIGKFISWIKSLFSSSSSVSVSTEISHKTAKIDAHKLIFGSKSERKAVREKLSKLSAQKNDKSTEAIQIKQGDNAIPVRQMSDVSMIVPKKANDIISALNKIDKMMDKPLSHFILTETNGSDANSSDMLRLLLQLEKDLVISSETIVQANSANCWKYIKLVSESSESIHDKCLIMADQLETIKRPNMANPSETECKNFILSVAKVLHADINDLVGNIGSYKYSKKVNDVRNICYVLMNLFRKLYTLEHKVEKNISIVMKQWYGLVGKSGTENKQLMAPDDWFEHSSTVMPFTVIVQIPTDLMNRIRDAWKCPRLKIRHVIISSTKFLTTNESRKMEGYANSRFRISNGKITGVVATKDVVINYETFKSIFHIKQAVMDALDTAKDNNFNVKQHHLAGIVEGNRAKRFIMAIIHETRHVYQAFRQEFLEAKKDSSRKSAQARSRRDYMLDMSEMDARKAADNFEFKDSDVEWATNVVNKCIDKETELIRYWKQRIKPKNIMNLQ